MTGGGRFTSFLQQANALFGTEVGIVSRIAGADYVVEHCAGTDALQPGSTFPLGRTYCALTLEAEALVAIHHMGASPHSTHPCYGDMGLETYVGIPLTVNGVAYGTLNFSAQAARAQPWTEGERCLVRVLAALVETALESRELEERVAEATAALERVSQALETSNRDLRGFASLAAHDLQAPVRTVRSFSKLLDQRYAEQLDPTALSWLGFVSQAAERMERLVQDLLGYAKLGSKVLADVPVKLEHVLVRVIHGLGEAAEGAELTHDALPEVRGDTEALELALRALLLNALAYRGDAPARVHVSSERVDETWVVSVADHGIGIEPRFHEAVFEPFRRLHGPEAIPGSGLGLATVRRVIEALGGRAWLDSTPGCGTTVSLELRAVDA